MWTWIRSSSSLVIPLWSQTTVRILRVLAFLSSSFSECPGPALNDNHHIRAPITDQYPENPSSQAPGQTAFTSSSSVTPKGPDSCSEDDAFFALLADQTLTVTGISQLSGPVRKMRRPKTRVAPEHQDAGYVAYRQKNNVASARNRQVKKLEHEAQTSRMASILERNECLRTEVCNLEAQRAALLRVLRDDCIR